MFSIKNMKVGMRLAAAFGIIVTLLIVIGVTSITRINSINTAIASIVDDRYVKVRLAFDVRDGVNDQIKYLRGMVIDTTRPEMNVKRYGQLDEATQRTNSAMKRIEDIQVTPVGKKKIAGLLASSQAFEKVKAELITLVKAGDFEAASTYVLKSMTATQNKFLKDAVDFANSQDAQLRSEGQGIVENGQSAISITLIFSALAILASILLGYFLTRSIVRPLVAAVDVAERVAAGDLSSQMQVTSRDETGVLMQALQRMNDNLLSIVTEVRTGSDTIAVASNQISSGNLDLSTRTEQQASSLEETASAMEQMTSTVKHNADNAREANHLVSTTSSVAREGGVVMEQVIEKMEAIALSSRKIVDIISVIDSIAFQTNILSLNAAVEAARAGEQGRGFAVVASEVRNLAQRSASAAKEIKVLIEDSVAKVDEGSKLVTHAGSTIGEVVNSVQSVANIMSEITIASSEQSSGINEINQAITQMEAVTQQNAALVQEASAASQALQDQAERMAQAMSVFNTGKLSLQPVLR
ncbi:methyl-accepting chemotaxis protein [Pantoea agglomerans]|jgi:methyl-accepting chemotaxis protein|uniref:methyl-accepting chemotaxis protein n=1 Tax=Pantoea TaxID=53335 RepID=UPI0006821ECF|nr:MULTISPECIES: methyl-accepting chemotaxis protein [Pantoea]KNH31707.1 chemotaxis protein [Pantoea vagans]WRO89510.1 methyl-accepting chemotaxis protein [Pantoea agglomerans]